MRKTKDNVLFCFCLFIYFFQINSIICFLIGKNMWAHKQQEILVTVTLRKHFSTISARLLKIAHFISLNCDNVSNSTFSYKPWILLPISCTCLPIPIQAFSTCIDGNVIRNLIPNCLDFATRWLHRSIKYGLALLS